MRVAGYELRVASCGLRVAGYELRGAGCGLRVAGFSIWDLGFRIEYIERMRCEFRVAVNVLKKEIIQILTRNAQPGTRKALKYHESTNSAFQHSNWGDAPK